MEDKYIFVSQDHTIEVPISKETAKMRNRKKERRVFVIALFLFSLTFAVLCATMIIIDSSGTVPEESIKKMLAGAIGSIMLEMLLLIISSRKRSMAYISIIFCLAVMAASVFGIYVYTR